MRYTIHLSLLLVFSGIATPIFAQNDQMAQLLEASRPNEHHRLLGSLAGTWAFQDERLPFVKGTVVRKAIYDGRFYTVEITGGRLQVPVADGKMKEDNYRGLQIEGYDNGRGQFVSISINNHIGSDIQTQMGTYDSATKAFTYLWENELIPGTKTKEKRVLKVLDNDQYVEEYFEERSGQFTKVRQLNYKRVKEK